MGCEREKVREGEGERGREEGGEREREGATATTGKILERFWKKNAGEWTGR